MDFINRIKVKDLKMKILFGAALTRNHRLGGINDRYLFFHSSRAWKLKVKMASRFILVRPLLQAYK